MENSCCGVVEKPVSYPQFIVWKSIINLVISFECNSIDSNNCQKTEDEINIIDHLTHRQEKIGKAAFKAFVIFFESFDEIWNYIWLLYPSSVSLYFYD